MQDPPLPATVSAETAFAFWCVDKPAPDGPRIRAEALNAHLAHVLAHFDRFAIAGPLRSAPDAPAAESLFIIRAQTIEEAWSFMRQDPYMAQGLYAEVSARHFTPAAGAWIGGKIW
jgi:uncharacterized protein YciI